MSAFLFYGAVIAPEALLVEGRSGNWFGSNLGAILWALNVQAG